MDIQHFDSITVLAGGRFFAGVIIGYGLKKGGECYLDGTLLCPLLFDHWLIQLVVYHNVVSQLSAIGKLE
jgi:hypothetical protein